MDVQTYERPLEDGEHVKHVEPFLTDPLGFDDAVRAFRRVNHARKALQAAAFILGL